MGSLVGKNLFVEGYFALMMYRALHKMHEVALHGRVRTVMNTLAPFAQGRTRREAALGI